MTSENRKPKTENCLFRVITFGCKVNQCDSAGMAGELSELGWSAAAPGEVPDLVLVNTCTVTKRADQQARRALRRLAREHPGAPIWVTGCYAQRDPAALAALPGVQAVFGNQEKAGLADILKSCCEIQGLAVEGGGEIFTPTPTLSHQGGGSKPMAPWEGGEVFSLPRVASYSSLTLTFSPQGGRGDKRKKLLANGMVSEKGSLCSGEAFRGPRVLVKTFAAALPLQPLRVFGAMGQTRARLKIQEGCSHRCSYCIVPQVRGPRRSLKMEAVREAMQELADRGYREVVLTGVDLGQYGLDHTPPGSLAGLVQRLALTPWPFRVRLSSLEPQMVTPELLEALAGWPNFCPHFHLPLQSGAGPVLAAMGRPYGPEEFRELVDEITRRFPGAGLGLDVLVGFPGETEADFAASRYLVDELPVTYLHVFPYSPRPGTPAADLPPLPGKVVQERARSMRELGQQKKQQFQEAQLGQVREVLVEGPASQPGYLQGLTDRYLRVALPGPATWRNRLIKVRIQARQGEVLIGEAVE